MKKALLNTEWRLTSKEHENLLLICTLRISWHLSQRKELRMTSNKRPARFMTFFHYYSTSTIHFFMTNPAKERKLLDAVAYSQKEAHLNLKINP